MINSPIASVEDCLSSNNAAEHRYVTASRPTSASAMVSTERQLDLEIKKSRPPPPHQIKDGLCRCRYVVATRINSRFKLLAS